MSSDVLQDNSALREYTKIVQCEQIQELLNAQADGTAVAIPEGVKIADLEKYLEKRRRYRGSMATRLINEFVEFATATTEHYSQEKHLDNVPCFVNPEDMKAKIFFNLGDIVEPGHGDHTALLILRETEAFGELKKINGNQLDQKTLAEWMEDWRDHLEAIAEDGTTIIPIGPAVSAVRKITIGSNAEATSETQTFSQRKSAMAEVEAKNRDSLPGFLKFDCEPYHGLEARAFTLRLSLITGDTPKIALRIVRLETQQEEMAKELEEKLRSGFEDTPVKTYVGTFSPD